MLVIKYISLVGVIVITSYIGFFKASVYVEREKEIQRILNSLNYMRNKIEYTNLLMKDIFKEISINVYNNKLNMFEEALELPMNIRNSFKEVILNNKKINDEDKNILISLALSFGNVDRKVQISEINIAYDFLLERLEDAKISKIKNVKMYKTLGIMFGLVISIILI